MMEPHFQFNTTTKIVPDALPCCFEYIWRCFIGWLGVGAAETGFLSIPTWPHRIVFLCARIGILCPEMPELSSSDHGATAQSFDARYSRNTPTMIAYALKWLGEASWCRNYLQGQGQPTFFAGGQTKTMMCIWGQRTAKRYATFTMNLIMCTRYLVNVIRMKYERRGIAGYQERDIDSHGGHRGALCGKKSCLPICLPGNKELMERSLHLMH